MMDYKETDHPIRELEIAPVNIDGLNSNTLAKEMNMKNVL